MNQYIFLMRGTDWDKELSPDQIQTGLERFMDWVEGMRASGAMTDGQPLFPVGRVIKSTNQEVNDGPFVESKEAVGGYFIVMAESLDEATELAKQCPVLDHGLWIEVRHVAVQCPMMDRPDIELSRSMV